MARIGTRVTTSCVLIMLLEFATSSPLFLKEGVACSDGGVAGTCLRVRHCPTALDAIEQRRPLPQRCSFVGHEEVVCCPKLKSDVADREVDTNDLGTSGDRDTRSGRNEISTSDDWTFPEDERPSVAACSSYKEMRGGLDDYILLGTLAGQKEFPHMAALGYNVPNTKGVSWQCGGTLISDQFVLTAAHCCNNRLSGNPVKVRLGVNNLTATADFRDYEISKIISHPTYRRRHYQGDIALLKLDRKVKFSDAIFPACLSTWDKDPPSFTVAGWGATNPAGTQQSPALMKTTIYPYELSDCQNFYKERFPTGLDTSVICAKDPQGKTDTCRGDSGAPLVTGRSAPYTAVGVTSLGPTPCGGAVPGLYTRVSSYLNWIEKLVWPQRGFS